MILHATGLPATVLHLRWPEGVLPAQLPDFETQARRLRYQALGVACRDRQIRSLLLGHHEDDQAENILLRIAQGHRGMGLLGMRPVAQIPQCWGIHGVHQSGSREFKTRINASSDPRKDRPDGEPDSFQVANSPLAFEDGGINIYRPLLEFRKDRLRATCKASKVRWVEDKTNRDPTRTPRNAIRLLLRSGSLPLSLQKASLLALRKRMCEKAKDRISRAKSLFDHCGITMLDTRSGGLVVRLRHQLMNNRLTPPDYRQKKIVEAEYRAALMLRQLLEIVTPQESISLQSLEFAVKSLFPEIQNQPATCLDRNQQMHTFTAGGVFFQRVLSPLQLPSSEKQSRSKRGEKPLDPIFVWVLTRQPYRSNSDIPKIRISPATLDPLPGPRPGPRHYITPNSALASSPFHLWDHRWWLRVHNPTPFPVLIRPLSPIDLSRRSSSRARKDVKELYELLRIAAPGKIRWTLPGIVQVLETGQERLLAVPTLGWDQRAREIGLLCEARYKKVDLGPFKDIQSIAI